MEISISLDPASGKDIREYIKFLNTVDNITLHADVMDGKFVSRTSLPLDEFSYLVKNTNYKIDVHLMVANPKVQINPMLAKVVWGNIRSMSFHVEACPVDEAIQLVEKIKMMGIQGGVVIDLDTSVDSVDKRIFAICDVVTIMSVKCGQSGQSFNEIAIDKVRQIKTKFPKIRIIVDGGINADNIKHIRKAGVNTAVVGNAVYSNSDRTATITLLQKA
ncbi:MAG: hypothetical protein FWE16_00985 [Firmicutes bacterium]|nr:hypothetical protein [Bacillota bacterium]